MERVLDFECHSIKYLQCTSSNNRLSIWLSQHFLPSLSSPKQPALQRYRKHPRTGHAPNSNCECQLSHNKPVYDSPHVDSTIEATEFAVVADTWSNLPAPTRVVRNIAIDDTFDINVQLYVPHQGIKKTSLQIATHGLGFDKRYWDAAVNPAEFSDVEAVLEAG